MDVRDSESDAWQKVLTIEVPPEELSEDYDAILEDYQKRAVLPGFRKGRVPRNVLELQFGHSLEHEVLERAVKRSYERAVREQNLEPVSYPAIDKIRFDKGKPLTYEAKVDIRPAVTPRDYFGLDIPSSEATVGDDEVDRALEDLRQRTADWVPAEREAALGDAVLVDYVRLNAKGKPIHHSEQKDALVELDASGLLPEFRQNLLGKKAGDNANFSVTYPAEFGNEELRGKSVTFSLQIKGVRERKVRALDDAFATEVVGMHDLPELKARIRLNLEGEAKLKALQGQEEAIVDQILAKNPLDLPESMVREYLEELLQRLKKEGREWTPEEEERFRAEYRPQAERRIKRDLLVDAIVRTEQVTVTEEEIDQTLRGAAPEDAPPQEAERLLRSPAQRDRARAHLAERKLFALLREKARLKMAV
ncbi:MAG TPA: trigger factor [Candidatus Dormibacteraeota bacterium]|nr:trigger factor [Candidatus Dormibacteraeota bacterium]